jgi:hypothetical protein
VWLWLEHGTKTINAFPYANQELLLINTAENQNFPMTFNWGLPCRSSAVSAARRFVQHTKPVSKLIFIMDWYGYNLEFSNRVFGANIPYTILTKVLKW